MRGETLEPLTYLTTKLRSLDGKLTIDQARRLVALPKELGFESSSAFLAAFRQAIGAEAERTTNDETADPPEDALWDETAAQVGEIAVVKESPEPSAEPRADSERTSAAQESAENESAETGDVDVATIDSVSPENSGVEVETSQPPGDDDLNARIKALVDAGKTRAQIAEELGITISRVRKARKELGLGRASGKNAGQSAPAGPRRRRPGSSTSHERSRE